MKKNKQHLKQYLRKEKNNSIQRTNKIAFLIAGGTAVNHEKPLGSSISSEKEAQEWLIPVQSFLCGVEITPVFFYNGEGLDMPSNTILDISTFILKHYDKYDGFVVSAGLASIPFMSAGLAFLLDSVGKPVIITGTPISYHNFQLNIMLARLQKKGGELGVKLNIIGACQTALLDLGEVCVVYGNKILCPTRLVPNFVRGLNFFETKDMPLLGRIDFGIYLFAVRPRRAFKPQIILSWDDSVAIIDMTAPMDFSLFLDLIKEKKAIILHTFHGEMSNPIREVLKGLCKKIPVILHTQIPLPPNEDMVQENGFIWIAGITLQALRAKTMWALGQEKDPKKFAEILLTERANEFFKEGKT